MEGKNLFSEYNFNAFMMEKSLLNPLHLLQTCRNRILYPTQWIKKETLIWSHVSGARKPSPKIFLMDLLFDFDSSSTWTLIAKLSLTGEKKKRTETRQVSVSASGRSHGVTKKRLKPAAGPEPARVCSTAWSIMLRGTCKASRFAFNTCSVCVAESSSAITEQLALVVEHVLCARLCQVLMRRAQRCDA